VRRKARRAAARRVRYAAAPLVVVALVAAVLVGASDEPADNRITAGPDDDATTTTELSTSTTAGVTTTSTAPSRPAGTAKPTATTVPPRTSGLLYVVDAPGAPAELWVSGPDGRNGRRLLSSDYASGGWWRPARAEVVFRSPEGYDAVRSDGAGRRRLMTSTAGAGTSADVDSAGSALVAAVSDGGTEVALRLAALDGGHRPLTAHRSGSRIRDYSPSFSPDGRRVVFARRQGDSPFPSLHVINTDGRDERLMIAGGDRPAWSPRNDDICFYRSGQGNGGVLYVAQPDGLGLRLLADAPGEEQGCVWSPDGGTVAFTVGTGDASTVYVVDADGSDLRRLDAPGPESGPVWSPDGRRIAFTASPGSSDDVYVVDADGGAPTRLVGAAADERVTDWR
jgi:hypothetical protein